MEVFGISGAEFLVICVVVILVGGADTAWQLLRGCKALIQCAKNYSAQLRETAKLRETSQQLTNVDIGISAAELNTLLELKKYDPRQLIREAIQEELSEWNKIGRTVSASDAEEDDVSPQSSQRKLISENLE